MPTLSKAETDRLKRFINELFAFQKRTDERTYGGPVDLKIRQIEGPTDELVTEGKRLLQSLASKDIVTPELEDFIEDRSPFEVKKVIHELRAVEEQYGQE